MESMCVIFIQADSYDGNKPLAKGEKHSAAKNVLKMIRNISKAMVTHKQRWKRRTWQLWSWTEKPTQDSKNMCTLTLSDVVEGPLIVLEKSVALDVIHSIASQTNFPEHSEKIQPVSGPSSAQTQ